MSEWASIFGSNLRSTISDWMPYISWSVVPAIIGLIKKYKPAWKEKVGEFWPVVAVVICILLNTIGVSIKPSDLDLPDQAPPGIRLSAPKRVMLPPAAPTGTILMYAPEEPNEAPLAPVKTPAPANSSFPLWLKVVLFSIMGGLGASKLYDEWKRRKLAKEACKVAVTKMGGKP